MSRARWTTGLVLLTLTVLPSTRADELTNEQLWTLATKAYQTQQIETGHIHLNQLIERNPGNIELALKSLKKILHEAKRQHRVTIRRDQPLKSFADYWVIRTARRICALERIGAISANSESARDSFEILLEHHIRQGQFLEALELIDRFVKKYPRDPFWRISEAHFHRQLRSSKTRALNDQLRKEMDLDHPDEAIRERWAAFAEETKTDREDLPAAIMPLPKGSPLLLMIPEDPEGEWRTIANRSARDVASVIHRVRAKSLIGDQPVLWRDRRGFMDPLRALDLHLRSEKPEDLKPLRALQQERFAQESTTESDPLTQFRRYPWAVDAQKRLLTLANQQLWTGHAHSALRSFQDLLSHTVDTQIRDSAQVGSWAAQAQITPTISPAQLLGKVNADRSFTWLGKPKKASEICQLLLAGQAKPEPLTIPKLDTLVQHVVRTPPVVPWSSNLPGTVDLSIVGEDLLISSRNVLASYNAGKLEKTKWDHSQDHFSQLSGRRNDYPGYFRPQVDGEILYTRWGFGPLPSGIAAIHRQTGKPLWSSEALDTKQQPRIYTVPMSDPVLSDGLLYYLQWNAPGNVNQARGRRLSLVCFDPRKKALQWEQTIAEAGTTRDVLGTVERARSESAIYGNRVTIHQGAIYSSTNCGMIARSDVRDGRTDWVHCYTPDNSRLGALNPGTCPIVVGDWVIVMPRDTNRIFALDQRTGRLVWENPFVGGIEMIGTMEDLIVVRGKSNLVALHQANGEVRWNRPTEDSTLGRAQMIGSSIYLAQHERLIRLNAKTGLVEESRQWSLKNEQPRNFTVHEKNLYVLTDQPRTEVGQNLGQPLNPDLPKQRKPLTESLRPAWTLSRQHARIAIPPKGSPLAGLGYLFSSGLLECIDLSAQGGIRWQRFLDVQDPIIHFVDNTLLVMDRTHGRAPGVKDRLFAYDAKVGRALWEQEPGFSASEIVDCGSIQIFHDARSRILALNLFTGERAWQRDFGIGRMLRLAWQEEQLHVLFVTHLGNPTHLVLDPKTGLSRQKSPVEPLLTEEGSNNAKPISEGYYEVTIAPVRARYVRLIAISEVNGAGWASIAELQVIGRDGKNLSRKGWKVHHVSSYEKKHKTNARPEFVFDGDRSSWWHSPWIDGIIPHPHEIQLDLGSEQIVTGIRYLPAVIINNNGMIRDYELYVSKDGKNWGDHVAKGILVNRMQVARVNIAKDGIYFETSNRFQREPRIFRYAMDGKKAKLVRENARLIALQEPYLFTTARNDKEEVLVVHRVDDEKYRFELGPMRFLDMGQMQIEEDRLVMARRGILVADLKKRQLLVKPGDGKEKHNQNGLVVREGTDNLLKIVPGGPKGQTMYRFNLRTGEQSEIRFSEDQPLVQSRQPNRPQRSIQHFDGVLLLNDDTTVTAWVAKNNP